MSQDIVQQWNLKAKNTGLSTYTERKQTLNMYDRGVLNYQNIKVCFQANHKLKHYPFGIYHLYHVQIVC